MVCVAGLSVRKVHPFWIFVLLVLFNYGGIQLSLAYKPDTYTIEANCGREEDVEKSLLPVISDWSSLPDNGSYCQVEIHSFSSCHKGGDNFIQLSILSLDLPGTHKPCDDQSRVDVMDADGKTFISDPRGLCGKMSHGFFTSHSDLLYIRVTSRSKALGGKVKILASAYNLLVCQTEHEFACDNHRCINKGLTCNGYDDCGDDSDEKDGCWLTTEVIAFIAVGSVTVVIVLVAISLLAYRRRLTWGTGRSLSSSKLLVN